MRKNLRKIFQDFLKSNGKTLKFYKGVGNKNELFYATAFTSREILEFTINELEKIVSTEEIRNFLRTLGFANTNLLQLEAMQNESVAFHIHFMNICGK